MKYIVLLRGINISGKNKISMSKLKEELENINYKKVITYLNTGNIILETTKDKDKIINDISNMLKNKFNLNIPMYIMKMNELKDLLNNQPSWLNNKELYNNIIFIIKPFTYQEVVNVLGNLNNDLEYIKKYKNNIFWSYNLKYYRKSNWWIKTTNIQVKDKITIRTVNTMKKILEICYS